MKIPFVDLKLQYQSIKDEVDAAIQNVIMDSAFIRGKYVTKFENDYAEAYNVKHCISCANGTDAIYISLKALGIGIGDEVITTALTWISTSEAISQTGAKVVFVDIDPEYNTINTSKIEEKITAKTKAIIPVHLYGHPANMDEIMTLAVKYDLNVIEDCAQAHFSKWEDNNVGTIGDIGTFSFFPGKNLGAYGDAGCIITNNDELAYKTRIFSNHGGLIKNQHEIEGINSRMDGLQAAILSVKLKYIEKWNKLRIRNASYYNDLFKEIIDIKTPRQHEKAKHVYHLYVIETDLRNHIKNYLNDNGISTGIHYPNALPFVKAYKHMNLDKAEFPVSSRTTTKILSLPIYPELDKMEINYIARYIEESVKK